MPPRVQPRAGLPQAALAFLRRKRQRPSAHWLAVWREEHAAAFTVAQMTRLDLVEQTHRALTRAIRQGETLETFRARLEPWLVTHGWTPQGRGGSIGVRLRRIYDVNLRQAHAAGQWDRITRSKALLPYLVYELGPSTEHRPDHAAWAGLCLTVDDPWWRTHYPPNGWGCKCRVRQVAKPPKGAVTTAPPTQTRAWTHPVTGEISEVPVGIDPGWDYHPARHAAAGTAQALTDRLQRLLAPRAGTSGPRRAALDRLARRQVETHLEGPGFGWFVERPRPAHHARERKSTRRRHLRPYGRHDKASPIVVWPAARAQQLGVARVGVLTDWGAGKQYWRHGVGRRRGAIEIPAPQYAGVQALVDRVDPVRDAKGRWAFVDADGWTAVFQVKTGVAQLLTYYQRKTARGSR